MADWRPFLVHPATACLVMATDLANSLSEALSETALAFRHSGNETAGEFADCLDRHRACPFRGRAPERVEACQFLEPAFAAAPAGTKKIAARVATLDQQLAWRTAPASGRSETFQRRNAFVEWVGPEGDFLSDQFRAGLQLLGPDTLYDRHAHGAEELYYVISGRADWQREESWRRAVVEGSFIHHPAHCPHAIQTREAPLLAFWIWRGDVRGESFRFL